jgi:hypothetical protein
LVEVNTVVRLRDPRGDGYIYDRCEVVGVMDLGEAGRELVLAPLEGFGPTLLLAEEAVWAAGFDHDTEATRELAEQRAAEAAKSAAAKAAKQPPMPWEDQS